SKHVKNLHRANHTRTSVFDIASHVGCTRPNENPLAVTVTAVDSRNNIYPLPVGYVGRVPDFTWISL
ncbi:MAG: hypothetical protein ND866_12085, partial [Pyrinomonadaceae bacterium]|nr:hypothetical protein [Pyrinomonadaceae bacterium]